MINVPHLDVLKTEGPFLDGTGAQSEGGPFLVWKRRGWWSFPIFPRSATGQHPISPQYINAKSAMQVIRIQLECITDHQ